ncbi:MAG TPA: hypothetical protein VM223_17000 [Planctomycetota bacterium]|nr:hypothetical protein [Planctomycetota bacterium]
MHLFIAYAIVLVGIPLALMVLKCLLAGELGDLFFFGMLMAAGLAGPLALYALLYAAAEVCRCLM